VYRNLFGALFLIWGVPAHAADLPGTPTPEEMVLLPEYCKVRYTDSRSPEFQAWMQRVGPKFMGVHHFCNGVNYINRYLYRTTDKKRDYYLSRALPEIDYVAKEMPPDFPLAGDIYLNRGIALQLMKKDSLAIIDFYKSIEHDPKQVRAYIAIADMHSKANNKSKALESITTGLRNVPDSKNLQKKYLELGGKAPFPKPIDNAPSSFVENAPAPKIDKGEDAGSVTKPDADRIQQPVPQSGQENAGKDAKDIEHDPGVTQPAPLGAPGNPYCRFCPPAE